MLLKRTNLILNIVFLLTVSGLAADDVEVYLLRAPDNSIEDITNIAVLQFSESGNDNALVMGVGNSLGGYITAELTRSDRGLGDRSKLLQQVEICNPFNIIERQQIEQLLQEHEKVLAGITDPLEYAIEVGRISNAQAVITGSVSCNLSEKEIKKDCFLRGKEKVIEMSLKTNASIRLVSVETGQIITSESIAKTTQGHRPLHDKLLGCVSDNPEELVDDLLKQTSMEFAKTIAPSFVLCKFDLEKLKLGKGLPKSKEKEIESQDEQAREMAKRALDLNELSRARLHYLKLMQDFPYSYEPYYNLGVLSEAAGNYEEAREFYQKAVQVAPTDKGFWDKQTKNEKCREALAEVEKTLSSPIVQDCVTPHAWPDVTIDEPLVGREELKKVSALRAHPGAGSEILVPILPQGIRVKILSKLDDWYHVELVDGKQGYIAAKNFE